MLPAPDKVIGCPKCGVLARVSSLLSGNTFGAQWWTDGKMVAPMLPETPEIARCRACAAFCWISDAPVVGEIDYDSSEPIPIPEEWQDAEGIRGLSEDEYFQALAEGLGKPRYRELYLRTRAWWAGNDRYRSEDQAKPDQPVPPRSPEATANLECLFKLLRNRDVEERLMKAETARELGRFKQAWKLLWFAFPTEYLRVAAFLRELIRAKDPMVREIPQVEERGKEK